MLLIVYCLHFFSYLNLFLCNYVLCDIFLYQWLQKLKRVSPADEVTGGIAYLQCGGSFSSELMQIVLCLLEVNTDTPELLTVRSLRGR